MKMNTQRNVMKCIGATLAVCSAIAMVGGTKSCSAKKTIKTKGIFVLYDF